MHSTLLFVISLVFSQALMAEMITKTPDNIKTDIEKQLKSLDPDIPIETIEKSPIASLFTIILKGGHILYSSTDGKYLIRGDMLEINNGTITNLTGRIHSKETAKRLSKIKREDMIIFSPKGETKGIVYAFTDVDCGYCRKLHQEIAEMNELGIELRYIAYPRGGAQTPTYKKMVSAWCANDKKSAMSDLKNGRNIAEKTCKNPVDSQIELGATLGITGTPALFLEDGRSIPGYRPAKEIARMMNIKPAVQPTKNKIVDSIKDPT